MKKIYALVLVILVCFTAGCSSNSNVSVEYKEDNGYFIKDNITYRFTGYSSHFAFETGKVYYGNGNQRYILIKNFKITKKIKNQNNINKYAISLAFNNKELFSDNLKKLGDTDLNLELANEIIEEDGMYNSSGYGESDAFLETTKDDFKNAIKMKIKYCYKNGKCETEIFDFKYVE